MHQPFSDLSGRRYAVQVISYDITDRKQVEEALKESEEKFHVLFDSVLTGTYVTELGGGILDVNDAGARLLGFDSPEELIGRKVVDFYKNPEDRARIAEGAKAGGIVGFEIEMIQKNGSNVSVLISTSLVELHGRKVFLTSTMDITDRKKAEEALRESEEKFRSLADNAPDIICTTDRAGVWTYANPAVEKILGYKREDVIGKNLLDFTQGEVAREYINLFKRVRDGKETIRDVIGILTHKNGSSRFFNISGSPNLDSHSTVRGYVGLMKDITEQKKAEEALKDSEERYRAVLEYNPDPMVVYDIDGKVIYFNPAFTRVFGWTLEECLRHRLDFFVPEENQPETQKMLERGLTNGYFSGIESRRYTKEGNILDVSVSGAVHRDSQGKPERAIVNIRDITEQKRLEAQFQQAQKMEAIGTLAGGIAHNFNNLLTGILGNASIMILSIDSSNPHYKNLKNIEKMVQNGSKLTNQLLGYARGGRYEVKPISLNQLVKETSDTFGETRKEITIHRELAKELYGIKADQGQIEQVLLNLYVNAAEAMPEGGDLFLKTMDVTVKDGRGKPYTLKPGNYVLLTVRDT
ncbi:MAG: PAS domain S-box protein, partial [Pseudomonadota bacterium]